MQRLNQIAVEDEPLSRELILQVQRERGGGHQQAYFGISGA